MKKVVVLIMLIAVSLCFILIRHSDTAQPVFKIGAVLPMSGKFADNGMSIFVGLRMAVDDLNRLHGKKYELVVLDTKSESKNAVLGFNKLVDIDKVDVVVTTMSDNSLALKPVALQRQKMLFCIASHTDIVKDNKGIIFRPCNTGAQESLCIANYIDKKLKGKTVFVYTFNTEAGLDCASVVETQLKGRVLGKIVYNDDWNVIKSITTPDSCRKADCVVVIGFAPYMGALIKNLRSGGFSGEILANVGFNNPSVISAAGDAAMTVDYVDYQFNYGSERDIEFKRRAAEYKKTDFSAMSYIAYDLIDMVNSAMTNHVNDVSVNKVRDFFQTPKQFIVNGNCWQICEDGSIVTGLELRKLENRE